MNQFRQGVVSWNDALTWFRENSIEKKESVLSTLVYLLIQSHPIKSDVEKAMLLGDLKATKTPCVMMHKSLNLSNLQKLPGLPVAEQETCFKLLMYVWRFAEERRIDTEKWWHSDLGDEANVCRILESARALDSTPPCSR
jgi:hypothetical protein